MNRPKGTFLVLIPIIIAFGVWISPLVFVPVPWPDDSAFYFVARDLFKWPPRWVMLPQAPFEPTYRIFNFNTMPLYPLLIGLGRWIGIDGSHLLKLWPLGAWGLTGSVLTWALVRQGLPAAVCLLLSLGLSLDPEARWASVLVRPESLIGLVGMILVLGMTFGFSKRSAKEDSREATCWWDPVSALLAIAAYAHFNAIHLVLPVVFRFYKTPKRLVEIGLKTLLYLSPWIVIVLSKFSLFRHQMELQWSRLAVGNDWLQTPLSAIHGLYQDMGSPVGWAPLILWASGGLWVLILIAVLLGIKEVVDQSLKQEKSERVLVMPALGWILSSLWLWTSKPEVWFVYYIHASVWCFAAVLTVKIWKERPRPPLIRWVKPVWLLLLAGIIFVFSYVDSDQLSKMARSDTWKWSTYYDFIDCIDQQLITLEHQLQSPKPFRVWAPTFPDITIELSRRHPDWDLTRTNDFYQRAALAVQHGKDVEAVVVPETINLTERNLSVPASQVPGIQSAWMTWTDYFLNALWRTPDWKLNRFICQRGRWLGFLFMNEPVKNNKPGKNKSE